MDWKTVSVPQGGKLFKVHNFTVVVAGTTYHLEVDEYADGSFSGHGEHSTDKSSILPTVSGDSVKSCIEQLLKHTESR